ncbi:MAG TPA: hypothetical protein VKH42_07030 [Vicinamibacterales bacterium]|nr:hypothetical protein [Vicinamibacterales bacterium]
MTTPLRYFWTAARPPASAFVAAALLFAYATFQAVNSPKAFEEILGLTLVGQALAASTGYRDRLIRGHFDPILAGRQSRLGVAVAHATLSIVPGLLFWFVIGLLERSIHIRHPLAFAAGPLVALLYVSVAVWTVSLVLGRNTGGVLWMAGLFMLAAAQRIHLLSEAYGTSSADLAVSLRAARAALIWPALLFTNGGYVELPVLIMVLLGAVATFTAGVGIILRLDAPLEGPS